MPKLIFIVGPTATGKSKIAFYLAKRLNTEIVSCDSMLVYREPSIINSKPKEYLKEIKHYFVDIISVEEDYSVFKYFSSAIKLIENKLKEKEFLIVAGGSCLYIKALLDGIFENGFKDNNLREELENKAKIFGKDYLHKELRKIDPITADKINDLRRIIRALEVYYLTGKPISEKKKESFGLWKRFDIKIFGLTLDRKLLYDRINRRVDKMFEEGAVFEVENLLKLNLSTTAKSMLGIKEIKGYLDGKYNIDTAKELLKKNTRHFAKRQITWFKKDTRIFWLNIENLSLEDILNLILKNV